MTGVAEPDAEVTASLVRALREQPARVVIALDYDGTLAPIRDDPDKAVPAPGVVEVLQGLAEPVGTLALITGRPAAQVVELGGFAAVPRLLVLGQYGAQRWHDGALSGALPLPGVQQVRAALPAVFARVGASGAWVEDKGIALVVHTRRCPDPAAALAVLRGPVGELASAHGLELHEGRLVLELRPPGFDKRGALLSLCRSAPAAVLFAGDDVGDLPAIDALDELAQQGVPVVRVCSASEEGPTELRERADLVVDGPAGVVALLEQLSRETRRRPPARPPVPDRATAAPAAAPPPGAPP